MNYCSECGSAKIVHKIPDGDHLPRDICASCGAIHYQNPKIIAGCIVEWADQILLCRRAIEPRYGLWTLPAGFMENRETLQQAAERETWEEAQAKVTIVQLYAVFSIPHISQVYMLFRGQLQSLEFAPGVESLEVKLFRQTEIPWQTIAFQVVSRALQHYFADCRNGHFNLHVEEIRPQAKEEKVD